MNEQHIENTTTPMRAMWVMVTPETALRWLDGNENNRSVRQARVNRYAADMRAGLWTPSNDAICISPEGRLLNGQHRLWAVIESKATVGMFVVTGMPEETFKNMDRGSTRIYADVLRAMGEKNTTRLGGALNIAVGFARGITAKGVWTLRDGSITDSDLTIYLEGNPDIRDSVDVVSSSKRCGITPSVLALAHHLIVRAAGREAADRYVYQLTTQDREPATGTIRAVLAAIAKPAHRDRDERNLAIILAGFNAWAVGREVKYIRLSADYRTRLPQIAKQVTR